MDRPIATNIREVGSMSNMTGFRLRPLADLFTSVSRAIRCFDQNGDIAGIECLTHLCKPGHRSTRPARQRDQIQQRLSNNNSSRLAKSEGTEIFRRAALEKQFSATAPFTISARAVSHNPRPGSFSSRSATSPSGDVAKRIKPSRDATSRV